MSDSKKIINDELEMFSAVLKDPENPEKGFREVQPPNLNLTPKGNIPGKERFHRRLDLRGDVYLHCQNTKTIRAKLRDLSQTGVGLSLENKLKGYRIGEIFSIEFSHMRRLQNLYIEVQLARVTREPGGKNQLGFRILTNTKIFKRRLKEILDNLKAVEVFWA